ncbi:MAG: efflux RND transporter periplasmic adaptor subunit [Armatimonadetes bacterium]|nr:efflux RND transporter periplasmic adaptor subunit [Armatimonadota bacterium]
MRTPVSEPELEDASEYDLPRHDHPARRLLLFAVIAVILIAVGVVATNKIRAAMHPVQQTQYKVATAAVDTVRKTVSATGTLQPWSTVDIKSKAGGRVNALLVDVGSVVRKNQVIARIDPTDTLLTVQTAQAGINGAVAHTRQAAVTYQLQTQQDRIAISNAQAALDAAIANSSSVAAQYASARSQARAQPALTATSIQQAEANYSAAVKARQELDATDPQDQAAAQATYDQALANQKAAKVTLARQVDLAQKGFVAQQTVDTDQASYDVYASQTQSALEKLNTLKAQQSANDQNADAKVAQAKAALASARAQSVDVATKRAAAQQTAATLKQAQAQVESAREALALAKANLANDTIKKYDIAYDQSQIASNQATLTNANTTLAQTVVRAPSDGVVLVRDVEQGTIITSGESLSSTGTTIVTIGDVSRMYVQATVDETDLANVDVGQDVDVSFDAYPGIPFQGKVSRVDPQAVVNQNVTQFDVRVEIDNSSPTFRLLKPGMNATCNFIADKKDDVLCVPNEAVQTDDQGSYVQVVTGGKPAPADPTLGTAADPNTLVDVRLHRRDVQVGLVGDDTTEITSGLKAGDRVVTQTIEPAPPTAAPAGASSPFGGGRGPGGFGGGRR